MRGRHPKQKQMILAHLRLGYPLTMRDALLKYGVGALSQRIGELKRDGHPIVSEMIEVKEGCRVAQYRLEHE